MSPKEPASPQRTYPWETVHVFVSSTFNDMHAERDYLVKEVFPELRDWCEERKLRLVDIDLRWGVSEADATHNQRVVQVCLQNIDRCRPFFLCFLGQRYGWIPGMADVSEETLARFPGLKAAMAEGRSVTELEVLHSVLAPFVGGEAKVVAEHSFFFLRDASYLAEMPDRPAQLKRIYTDEAEEDPMSRAFLVERQRKLREVVSDQKRRPVRKYSARWNPEARTPELSMPLDCPATLRENKERWRRDWQRCADVRIPGGARSVPKKQSEAARMYNQQLCAGRLGDFWSHGRSLTEVIVDDLKAAILKRFPERTALPEQDDLSREIDRHEDFVRTAAEVFIERPDDFTDLNAYAEGNSQNLFGLVAKAGLGKSTLLANWVARWRSRPGKPTNETVHSRFVGVGERSNNVDSLLRSILAELRRAGKLSSEIPDNGNVLRSKLPGLLGESGKKGRTVVVIDAINQLQSGLSDLDWLARTLPENVKLVVSFKLGDSAGDVLAAHLRADDRVTLSEVRPFVGLEERRQLVRHYLRQFLKELDGQHLEALIRADGANNPLFLKVVLTELRVFGAFGQLGKVIRREFGTTPQSAFEAVLRRLENDPSYAAVPSTQAVPLLFGLLAHSRGGLPEDLLARMLLTELALSEERLSEMKATVRIFLRQVRPFLARRHGKTDFFYEAFLLAARARCLLQETRRNLAEQPPGTPASETKPGPRGVWRKLLALVPSRRPHFGRDTETHSDAHLETAPARSSSTRWHARLARGCEEWSKLQGPAQEYALGNLVCHEVEAKRTGLAAEALTDFGFHHKRLTVLGRGDTEGVLADFGMVARADGLAPELREGFATWSGFYSHNAHLLQREADSVKPATILLQLAVAHAETSPVTASAERWLATVGSESPWLRRLGRPAKVEQSQCLRTLEGHGGTVNAAAVLPDGNRLLSASDDGTLKLWELSSGQCWRTFRGHRGAVNAIALLPDGRRAVSAGEDRTLRVWDLETGRCLRVLEAHKAAVNAVAVSPDGQRAVSGDDHGCSHVWNLRTGRCLRTISSGEKVFAVATLSDGRRMVSGGASQTLTVWSIRTGRQLQEHSLKRFRDVEGQTRQCATAPGYSSHAGWVRTVAAASDGRSVLCGIGGQTSGSGMLKLVSLDRKSPWFDLGNIFFGGSDCPLGLEGHGGETRSVAMSADGRMLFSGSDDGTVKVWDATTGRCQRTLRGHIDGVRTIAACPDGRRLVSGGADETLRIWDLAVLTEPDMANAHDHDAGAVHTVFEVAISADGRRAVSSANDGNVVWDAATGTVLRRLDHLQGRVRSLSSDGRLGTMCAGNAAELLDLRTGERLRTFEAHSAWVATVMISPDQRRMVTFSDLTLKLWDLETGACLRTITDPTGKMTSVALLPDGCRAISGCYDKTMKLWDLDSGTCLRTMAEHTERVKAVSVCAEGRWLVSQDMSESDKTPTILRVWDVETGVCQHTLTMKYHHLPVAVSERGHWIAYGGWGGWLTVLQVETCTPVAHWFAGNQVADCAVGDDVIAATISGGEVLFLKLMPPGRITPETFAAIWHPARLILAIARASGALHLQAWHPEAQFLEEIARTSVPSITSVQWSSDGAHLLASSRDGATCILDATTLKPASASGDWAPSSLSSHDGRWRAVIEAGQLRIVPVSEA